MHSRLKYNKIYPVRYKTPKKIKIAFIIDQINQPVAGTEIQVVKTLQSLDKTKFSPILILLRPSTWIEANLKDIQYYSVNLSKMFSLSTVTKIVALSTWLRKQNVAIIQTFFKDASLIGVTSGILSKTPLILTSKRNLGYNDSFLDRWLYRLLDSFIDVYMTNSSSIKNKLINSDNIHPDRIRVFYNLVEVDLQQLSSKKTITEFLGLGIENDIIFLMIANLRPVKCHDLLLRSIKKVESKIRDSKFLLVGGGPLEDQIKMDIHKLNLSHKVSVVGLKDDVRPFLKIADVGLLCSSSEGFSSTLLEYTASGLPVIATDVGSNRDIVIDGYNGILVQPGRVDEFSSALIRLYVDSDLREMMGSRGLFHYRKNFDPDASLTKLEDFYLQAVEHKKSL